jgi:hypothetical protein
MLSYKILVLLTLTLKIWCWEICSANWVTLNPTVSQLLPLLSVIRCTSTGTVLLFVVHYEPWFSKWKDNNPTCVAVSLSLFHSVVSFLPHTPEQRCDEPCCRPILCTTYVEYPLCSVVTLLPLADQDRCKACSIPAASNLWAVEKCTRFIFITTELGSQHVFVAIYCDLWVGKTPSTHTPKQVTRLGSS